MRIDNIEIQITGHLIKIAKIKEPDEYFKDVEDPESLIKQLKNIKVKADIFTFWQRLPETKAKYNYWMEWDNVAAIPIKSYDYWFNKQIHQNARNKIRKAKKKGVVVRLVDFNDELIKGMMKIFNETPIRQGKPYIYYGRDFKTVKREWSDHLDLSDFIGAYYNDDLIGFIKLINIGRYARTSGTVSKIEHRDKSPMNALIAKSVEICEEKRIPYLVYSKFSYYKKGSDTLSDFKYYNGFEKINLPRYYIPLTIKGKIALRLNLHHGILGLLPGKVVVQLINLRKKLYSFKFSNP